MAIVKDFLAFSKELLTWGPKANAQTRDEIIDVIGKLQSALDRALQMAIIYLQGCDGLNDQDLYRHILHSRQQLLTTCNEFEICAALDRLADRFGRLFDPSKGAVRLGQRQVVVGMIRSLQDRERSVLDSLADDLDELSEYLRQNPSRRQIDDKVDATIQNLSNYQKQVRAASRKLLRTF